MSPTAGYYKVAWQPHQHFLPATVMLATAKKYDPLTLSKRIACHRPRGLWSHQHAAAAPAMQHGSAGAWSVDTVTYRMPEYALSSVQDWRSVRRPARLDIYVGLRYTKGVSRA